MITVALVGATGGIGNAMLSHLSNCETVQTIYATYFRTAVADKPQTNRITAGPNGMKSSAQPIAVNQAKKEQTGAATQVLWSRVDITDESSIKRWLSNVGEFDWLINCAGFLHDADIMPEKSISQFDPRNFQKCINVNCLANLLLAKYAVAALKQSERGIFASITAKVGSIEDNRLGGWYSYRAAKVAANMVLKNLSVEWQRTAPNVRVVALHPGTTDTKLSKPFQARMKVEQLFSPEKVAALLYTQLTQLHDFPSGRFIAYDGEELPW